MQSETNLVIVTRETPRENRIIHVYPANEDHEISGEVCWCFSRNEWVEGQDGLWGLVIVHNRVQ